MKPAAVFSIFLVLLALSYAKLNPSLTDMATEVLERAAEHVPAVEGRAKRNTVVTVRTLSRMQYHQCQATKHQTNCENGNIERLYRVALECEREDSAQFFEFSCGQNANNYYCIQAVEIVSLHSELLACQDLGACDDGCRSAVTTLNEELGCCAGHFINAFSAFALEPTLWALCGVTTESLCTLPPYNSTVDTRVCTDAEYNLLSIQTACLPEVIQPVIDAQLENENCESLAVAEAELCGFNGADNYCVRMDSVTPFAGVSTSCTPELDSEGCSQECIDALMNLKNQLGCCINAVLNGTFARVTPTPGQDTILRLLEEDFWARCNVATPGFCESTVTLDVTLVDGATRQAAAGLSVALMMLLSVLAAF